MEQDFSVAYASVVATRFVPAAPTGLISLAMDCKLQGQIIPSLLSGFRHSGSGSNRKSVSLQSRGSFANYIPDTELIFRL